MFTSKGFNILLCVLAYFPIGITQNWSPLSFMGLAQHAGAQIFLFIDMDSACFYYCHIISSLLSCLELIGPEARGDQAIPVT